VSQPAAPTLDIDDHDFYPVHEEDHVPETPLHLRQWHYLVGAIQAELPHLWVTGDTCLYWERGNTRRYVAPDLAVIDCPPPQEPTNVYLRWRDPELLFVGEVGSRSTLRKDTGPKVSPFEKKLRVPEYLYCDPPKGDLRFWRIIEGRYHSIPPDAAGRVWSAQLGLSFGYDETGFLRVYDRSGRMLLTHEEERARGEMEARRAAAEARRAETEHHLREEAERRMGEMAAELERLRRGAGGA
jgi:Uma2 family endonuclease